MSNNRIEASSREIRAIEFLAELDKILADSGESLESRLRSVPDLYRQYRIAQAAMTKVINGLYDSLPRKTLLKMQRTCETSELVVRPRSILSKFSDTKVVLSEDMDILVNAAMSSRCAFCIESGEKVKQCKLRKALIDITPPEKLGDDKSLCEYTYKQLDDDNWDYI